MNVRDDRGAIMIIGVFMAIFLAGMLFYLLGVTAAVFHREEMQDGSDALAFAAASIHARGMNFLVLINQIMAAMLAVLVALKLIDLLATWGIFLAIALAWTTAGASTSAIPPLSTVRTTADELYDALEGPVHAGLKALHIAETAIAATIPALAEVEVVTAVTSVHKPPVDTGVVIPPALTLPVENDDYGVLCAHAGGDVAAFATVPIDAIPVLPAFARDKIDGAVADLASSATSWFCGTGSAPPAVHQSVTRVLPTLAAEATCEDAGTGDDVDGQQRACDQMDARQAASAPDSTGACTSDCGSDGAYEERVEKARQQCNPGTRSGLTGFWWQERLVRLRARDQYGGILVKPIRTEMPPTLRQEPKDSGVHPCGTKYALYSPGFVVEVHPSPGDPTVVPVCASPPVAIGGGTLSGEQEMTEVLQIFRCQVVENKTINGHFDAFSRGSESQGSDDETPMRVKSDLVLGAESFQLRGVAVGSNKEAWIDQVIDTATWGRSADKSNAVLGVLDSLSISQAEYYFDGKVDPAEWMWSRNWTARLRRVHPPSAESPAGSLLGACPSSGTIGPCSLKSYLDLSSH